MAKDIIANCKCGAVRFKTASQPLLQLVCHCADCRAATGADFSTIVFFKKAEVEVLGAFVAVKFTSDLGNKTQRLACQKCGTSLFDESDGFANLLGVMANAIALPFVASPKLHVWTQSKLEQVKIPAGVKSFEKGLS